MANCEIFRDQLKSYEHKCKGDGTILEGNNMLGIKHTEAKRLIIQENI